MTPDPLLEALEEAGRQPVVDGGPVRGLHAWPVPPEAVQELLEARSRPDGPPGFDDEPIGPLFLEVLVDGEPPARPDAGPCPHRAVNAQVVSAAVAENPDGTGPTVRRELLVKARCAECGVPFRMPVATARESSTVGDLGIVVDLEALEE